MFTLPPQRIYEHAKSIPCAHDYCSLEAGLYKRLNFGSIQAVYDCLLAETAMASSTKNETASPAKSALKFAMVCACNMNRSMAAHKLLAESKYVLANASFLRRSQHEVAAFTATMWFHMGLQDK